MATVSILTPKIRKQLKEEYVAHLENRRRDTLVSIEDRTMTKTAYYRLNHALRLFFWRKGCNQLIVGDGLKMDESKEKSLRVAEEVRRKIAKAFLEAKTCEEKRALIDDMLDNVEKVLMPVSVLAAGRRIKSWQ